MIFLGNQLNKKSKKDQYHFSSILGNVFFIYKIFRKYLPIK